MNLTRLQYFIEVARSGSFSEAAQKLYTSQPNLSKQISAFERELGFAVFTRTTRSVRLTPAGQYLYDQLQGLPQQIHNTVRQAAQLSRNDASRICIGVLEGQEVSPRLTSRLAEVARQYPDLQIELERNSFQNLRSGLTNLHYDLIITMEFEIGPEPEYRRSVFLSQPVCIAIHKDNPLSQKRDLTLLDLREEEFVVISPEESERGFRQMQQQCRSLGFEPKIARRPRTLESLLLCVEAGMGVALLDSNIRLESKNVVRTVPLPASHNNLILVALSANMTPELEAVMRLLSEPKEESEKCV